MTIYTDTGKPNSEYALESYKELAHRYDAACHLIQTVRHNTIEQLTLVEGDTVFDVASGTGLSLAALSRKVGRRGRVIAIELSPDMAAIAQRRIQTERLKNVEQVVAPVETATIGRQADALLLHYTHDVLRSHAALERLFKQVKPGAHIAIAGFKFPTDWRRVFNQWHRYRERGYISTYEGAHAPWDRLLPYVTHFKVHEEFFMGSGYIASARAKGSIEVPTSIPRCELRP